MAVALAFPWVVLSFPLPAVLVPGRDWPRQARRRAAAAAARHRAAAGAAAAAAAPVAAAAGAAGAVVAKAADHKRPAFFLFGRAPHPRLRRLEAA